MSEEFSLNYTSIEENLSAFNESNNETNNYLNVLLELLRKKHDKPISTEDLIRNILIIFCYSVIVIVSLCGNLLVVKVIVFGKRKMCTTTNILIASLAFSDIVMTTFNIPFNVARLLLESWPFGSFLCVSVPFIQISCVYVSTFTMAVIAFYRYWTVSRTTASKSLSSLQLAFIIGFIWSLAALLSIPHCIFNKLIIIPTIKDLVRCHVIHPDIDFNFPLWLSVEAFTTQYLIPLSITIWLYIKIGYIVSKQGTIAGQSTDQRKRIQSEARKRRILMLVLVVIVFAITWLPINLYHLAVDFRLIKRHFIIFILCHWLAMSSVCYNPFIYCYLNSSFRNAAKKLYQTIICKVEAPVTQYLIEDQTYTTNVNNIEMTQMRSGEDSE